MKSCEKLLGYNANNKIAYLGMQPSDFFKHLVEFEGCPGNISMSEGVWSLFLKPLYEQRRSDGNSKLAEILYIAARALQAAQLNGAEFEVIREAVGEVSESRAMLEVFIDEENGTPAMEIGIAGERELTWHPDKMDDSDKPPTYFMLHTIGNRT